MPAPGDIVDPFMNIDTDYAMSFDATGMQPVYDYPDTGPQAYSDMPCYDDEPAAQTSWLRAHWKSLLTATELVLAAASFVWVVTHVQSSTEVIAVPSSPSVVTTVVQAPEPTMVILPPVTVTPPPVAEPPAAPPSEPTAAETSPPSTQLFPAAEDQQLLQRLQQHNVPVDDNTINMAHDACIMIQDGDEPSQVDHDTATTTGLDLRQASLLVADAQMSYSRCFRGGGQDRAHH